MDFNTGNTLVARCSISSARLHGIACRFSIGLKQRVVSRDPKSRTSANGTGTFVIHPLTRFRNAREGCTKLNFRDGNDARRLDHRLSSASSGDVVVLVMILIMIVLPLVIL